MRDPAVKTAEEKHVKDAVEEAVRLLRPLTHARSWSIVNWGDPTNHPKAEFDAAIELVDAILSDLDADSPLGPFARIAREAAIPVRGCPPISQKRGQHPGAFLLRDRWIAAVVGHICLQFRLNPTRNETTEGKCGCSIVAEVLKQRLGFERLGESQVQNIWRRHRQ